MRIAIVAVTVFLSACGGARLKESVQNLRSPDPDRRAVAANYLINNGGLRVLVGIVEVLKDDLPENRAAAVYCLSNLKDPQVIPHLVESEKDVDRDVRAAAVDGLSLFGSKGIDALLDLTSPGHKEDVRSRAAWALGHMGDTRVFEPLVQILNKPTAPETVRAAAARALGCLYDGRAYKPLARAVDDEGCPSSVRCAAAMGLVVVSTFQGDRSAMEMFGRLRSGSTQEVRMCMAHAYSELYEPSGLGIYCKK